MNGSIRGGVCAVIGLALLAGAPARAAEEAATAAADDGRESQATAPRGNFIRQSKPCGTAADFFLCGTVTKATVGNLYLAPFSMKFSAKGRALVTWQGIVDCQVDSLDTKPAATAVLMHEANRIHLGLTTKPNEDFNFNAPGVMSAGDQLSIYTDGANGSTGSFRRVFIAPVTVSKVYNVKGGKTVNFTLAVKPQFLQSEEAPGLPSCGVFGGTTIVQFAPD